MGRPKEFDREETITKALELFWQNGFSNTSTQQLVEHLSINRKSMYAEFGNKQSLFETALARYKEMVVDKNFGPLENPSATQLNEGKSDSIVTWFEENYSYREFDAAAFVTLIIEKLEG